MINGQAESGQISWNKLLATKAREYIKSHPDEFLSSDGGRIETGTSLLQIVQDTNVFIDGPDEPVEQSTTTSTKLEPDGTASSTQTTTTTKAGDTSTLQALLSWLVEDPVRGALAVALLALLLVHLRLRFSECEAEPCLITVKEGRAGLTKTGREL
jgi:hypothetical protein